MTTESPDIELDPEAPAPGAKRLSNLKRERFAQFVARDVKPRDAYVQAGYVDHPKNPGRLVLTAEVAERIEWLRSQINIIETVDETWVRGRLVRLVRLAMATTIDDYGQEVLSPTGSLSSANRALELLGKDLGMFKERVELGGKVQIANEDLLRKLKPEEREFIRRLLVEASARSLEPANDDEPSEAPGIVASEA